MDFATAHPALRQALAQRGYAEPTSVQSAVLAAEPGRDLLVSAQTGSGKTVAFGLAIATNLLADSSHLPPPGAPLALLIAPTRELALQVREELAWLYAPTHARIVTCVGGMDPRAERATLLAGCHIVVGTPGRLRDHIERAQLDLSQLRAVVLDEADEMLDLGFREDLEFILHATPATRRTLLFSATIARGIATLAHSFQTDALRLDTVRRDQPHADIDYRAVRIPPGAAEKATVNLLRFHASPGALVFCATREAVRHMHAGLLERGFSAVALSGELSQTERNRALKSLRDGRASVCVATDVAARGLDLPSLDLVIHADLPGSSEALLHRSGRTGRAGRKGVCAVLVPTDRFRRAQTLFAGARITVQWDQLPTAEDIQAVDDQRLLSDPALTAPASESELRLAQRLLSDRPADHAVAALLRLVRTRLPAPEDIDPAPTARHAPHHSQSEPSPRRPARGNFTDGVRFRVALGRRNKADPKWLLPLLCRIGGVTREAIGRIEIGDKDSIFEVTGAAADQYRAALENPANTPSSEIPRITELGAGGKPPVPKRKPFAATASTRKRKAH
jgi:ATP-dependent RNA helicase DeaD